MSEASKTRPEASSHWRTSMYSGVTPKMTVDQFWLPQISCAVPRSAGADMVSGISRGIAAASSSVMVRLEPKPMRTPPEVVVPDRISSRLEPSERICSSTRFCAPAPTAIITITAATPMMMPSMVSTLRSLFTASARIATRSRPRTSHAGVMPGSARSMASASSGFGFAWSSTRCPSRKRSTRCAKRATSASCVTSSTVMPP